MRGDAAALAAWGKTPGRPPVWALAGRVALLYGAVVPVVAVLVLLRVGAIVTIAVGVLLVAGVTGWLAAQGRLALRWTGASRPQAGDAERMVNLTEGLSQHLDIDPPEVLVIDHGGPNALVCMAGGAKLAVTRSLLEIFTRTEQEAVAAHCLVRIAAGGLWGAGAAAALGRFGAGAAPRVGEGDDVAAAALTRYPPALASAISKSEPRPGRFEALWFVGAGPAQVPPRRRIAALDDL